MLFRSQLAEKATKQFDSNGKADYTLQPNTKTNLVNCEYFTTNILDITKRQIKEYSNLDSFVVFMCVEGQVEITAGLHTETVKMGETILIPANTQEVTFNSDNAKLLEVYVNKGLVESIQHAS